MREYIPLMESPNYAIFNDEELYHYDIDAIGFFMDKNKRVFISQPGFSHGSISYHIENGNMINNFGNGIMEAGRVWMNSKYIAFYDELSQNEILVILNKLQKEVKNVLSYYQSVKDIIDASGKKEHFFKYKEHYSIHDPEILELSEEFDNFLLDANVKKAYFSIAFYTMWDELNEFSNSDLMNFFIEVDGPMEYIELRDLVNTKKNEYVQHILSPMEKEKLKQQNKLKTNYTTPKNSFKKEASKLGINVFGDSVGYRYITESPDEIQIENGEEISFDDFDAIPFGIYDGQFIIDVMGELHGGNYIYYIKNDSLVFENKEYFTRNSLSISGRFWLYYNIISFWDYPKSQLTSIINSFKTNMKWIYDKLSPVIKIIDEKFNNLLKTEYRKNEEVKNIIYEYVENNISYSDIETAFNFFFKYAIGYNMLEYFVNVNYNKEVLVDTWNIFGNLAQLVSAKELLDYNKYTYKTNYDKPEHVKSPMEKTNSNKFNVEPKNTFKKEASKLGISVFGDSANDVFNK